MRPMPQGGGRHKFDLGRRLSAALPESERARLQAFSFLQIPSKNFHFFPRRLPKASIAFQKLQKISENRDLSRGYGRTRRKKLAGAPIAAGGPNRRAATRRNAPMCEPPPARPPDFHFLQFPSKGFNFFPRRLPKASIAFQKLQKISANRDLSRGYGRTRRKKTCRRADRCRRPDGRRAAARPCARRPGEFASAAVSGLASLISSSLRRPHGLIADGNKHSIDFRVQKAFVDKTKKHRIDQRVTVHGLRDRTERALAQRSGDQDEVLVMAARLGSHRRASLESPPPLLLRLRPRGRRRSLAGALRNAKAKPAAQGLAAVVGFLKRH